MVLIDQVSRDCEKHDMRDEEALGSEGELGVVLLSPNGIADIGEHTEHNPDRVTPVVGHDHTAPNSRLVCFVLNRRVKHRVVARRVEVG